jgi:putative ABC transport system permease protein
VQYDTRPTEDTEVQYMSADTGYVGLYGLTLVAGRNMAPSDTAREVLVNEAFVRKMAGGNPQAVLGKFIHRNNKARHHEIVGVLKDYHQRNLHDAVTPLLLVSQASGYYSANIQVRSGQYERAIGALSAAYNRIYPDSYFEHQFVDEAIGQQYREDQMLGTLVNGFAGIALLIGCMGLYGLVLFMVAQKTKEIGVRKVLGANLGSILCLAASLRACSRWPLPSPPRWRGGRCASGWVRSTTRLR